MNIKKKKKISTCTSPYTRFDHHHIVMDTSSVLDKYTQDLSNLPLEIRHLLEEIRNKDIQVAEIRKQFQIKDSQIHKFIRTNGTLAKHPKEQQIYTKIEEDMKQVKKVQKEKILLANTALFLVSKHLFNFETDITKLERDELLPPLEAPVDIQTMNRDDYPNALNGLSDTLSATPTPRNTLSVTPAVEQPVKKGLKRKAATKGIVSVSATPAASSSRANKRLRSEEVEDNLGYDAGSLALSGSTADVPTNMDGPQGEDADNNLYCFCQRVSFGEMIGCDNEDCKYEWFHWSCVGITSAPKPDEIWYCPDCRQRKKKKKA